MSDTSNQHIEASRLSFLYDIVTDGDLSWEERIGRLLTFGSASFGLQIGILAKIQGDDFEVVGVGPANPKIAVGDHFVLGQTYCATTLNSPAPLSFIRASGTEWEQHPCFQSFRLESYLGIRITVSGRVWGTLNFSSWQAKRSPFAKADRQFLELMARWIERELERTEKNRQLVELSEWQRVILESANYSIIATSTEGVILHFNRAAEAMLGYRAEEVVGRHTPALIHDMAEVVERAESLSQELGCRIEPGFSVFVEEARRGGNEEREWTYIRKDGYRFPVLLSISALRDAGEIRGYLGIAVDLTARKQLERQAVAVQAYELSHSLVRTIAEGIVCLDTVPPYRIRFVNPYAAELLGMTEKEAGYQALADILDVQPESVHGPASFLDHLAAAGGTAFDALVRTPARPEGFPAAISIAPAADGSLLVLTVQDITRRRQAEQSLRLAGKVFEVCAEAIMITDAGGTILNVNPAFTWLTGYRPDEVVGQNPRLLKSGRHDEAFYDRMWSHLVENGEWCGEVWDRRKDGSSYPKWLTINAVREEGRLTHFVAMFRDISEQKNHEGRMRHLAEHDPLTGLPNRRLLESRVAQLTAAERRDDPAGFALILIDLDRFKSINDTLGHQAGDQVLIEVARRLMQSVRVSDTVARLGGDEFVILLPGVSEAEDLAEILAKIHHFLNEPIAYEGQALLAPPSMGVALYPQHGNGIETLLRQADTAMYQTKSRGRNGWTIFDGTMPEVPPETAR